jgi:hypothetical protein
MRPCIDLSRRRDTSGPASAYSPFDGTDAAVAAPGVRRVPFDPLRTSPLLPH